MWYAVVNNREDLWCRILLYFWYPYFLPLWSICTHKIVKINKPLKYFSIVNFKHFLCMQSCLHCQNDQLWRIWESRNTLACPLGTFTLSQHWGTLHPTPEYQNLLQKNPNTWTISPENRPRVSSDPTTSTRKMVLSLSRSQKPVIHSLQVRRKHLPDDKQFWTQALFRANYRLPFKKLNIPNRLVISSSFPTLALPPPFPCPLVQVTPWLSSSHQNLSHFISPPYTS